MYCLESHQSCERWIKEKGCWGLEVSLPWGINDEPDKMARLSVWEVRERKVKWHLEFWLQLLLAGDALAGVWVWLMLPLKCAVIHWWFRSWCWRCRCRFVRVELILKTLEWLKSHGTVVSNLFGNRDQFHGRQLFHRLGVEGWFWDDLNALHFLCTFISNLMLLLIWLEGPVHGPEFGDSWHKGYIEQGEKMAEVGASGRGRSLWGRGVESAC